MAREHQHTCSDCKKKFNCVCNNKQKSQLCERCDPWGEREE